MADRQRSEERGTWPMRPWLMAAIGALAGLAIYLLMDKVHYGEAPTVAVLLRQAAAAAIGVAALAFILTAERVRLNWSVAFAIAWGTVIGLVGYSTGAYNRGGELVEFPFLAGLLAAIVAAPLFQAMRDEGRRALPYQRVHAHAWGDAIIGGASLAFTGLTFLLTLLFSMLFDAIGIPVLNHLLDKGWFDWMLAGAAFGAAAGTLRNREALLGTLQKLVMAVFSVLAPVLAAALALFLVALPATGFAGLWKSGLPETPLLLSAAAFAVVFLNAVIGDSPADRSAGRLWRVTEIVLLLSVLPLGALALVSMGMRVGQYGWTPERLWGVIACLVAIAYGAAAWFAAVRARRDFDGPLREYQKRLALGLCGLALFLALPIVDFGAISARSQLARLNAGKVKADQFDWAAMAFDFGPAGRQALAKIARGASAQTRQLASEALKSETSYDVDRAAEQQQQADNLEQYIHVASPDIAMTDQLRRELARRSYCDKAKQCVLFRADPHRLVLVTASGIPARLGTQVIDERDLASSSNATSSATNNPEADGVDLDKAKLEVRTVTLKLVYVDGKPVGDPFE